MAREDKQVTVESFRDWPLWAKVILPLASAIFMFVAFLAGNPDFAAWLFG